MSSSAVAESIEPVLAAAATEEFRSEKVLILAVDKHVWHHV